MERGEKEKKVELAKDGVGGTMRRLSLSLSLFLSSLPSFLRCRACVVRYSTARCSTMACAFAFSTYAGTRVCVCVCVCVEKSITCTGSSRVRDYVPVRVCTTLASSSVRFSNGLTGAQRPESGRDNRPMSRSFSFRSPVAETSSLEADTHREPFPYSSRSVPITNARPMFVSSNVRVNRTSLATTRGYSLSLSQERVALSTCGLITSRIISGRRPLDD